MPVPMYGLPIFPLKMYVPVHARAYMPAARVQAHACILACERMHAWLHACVRACVHGRCCASTPSP